MEFYEFNFVDEDNGEMKLPYMFFATLKLYYLDKYLSGLLFIRITNF